MLLLSGSGVSQGATLNINDSMQIKVSLFRRMQRQGRCVRGQINPLQPPYTPTRLFKPLSGYHETENGDQLDEWDCR